MFDLSPLTASAAADYTPLTFPRYRALPATVDEDPGVIGIRAACGGELAGLALAYTPPGAGTGRVLSLVVTPGHRGQGLGTALMERLEGALREGGCKQVRTKYTCDSPSTPAFERVLQKRGWEPPALDHVVCRVERRDAERFPWLNAPLPDGFTAFPWAGLSEAERQAIRDEQAERPWYPEALSPFAEPEIFEPSTSLGLRRGGRAAGWMITHRIAPDTVRYSSLFVRKECRGGAAAFPLLAMAIRRQMADPTQCRGLFLVHAENARMARLMRRHLAPYAASVIEQRTAVKRFDLPSDDSSPTQGDPT